MKQTIDEAAGALGRVGDLAFWAVAIAFVATIVYVHSVASLTLPVPSGDEALFVWQARAFQLTGAFTAPELDPSRPIMLLPFVYSGVVGAGFALFGASLEVARDVSLALTLGGFVLLAFVVRRQPAPLLALIVVGALLLNPRFVVMANQVRMEPLLFVVICAALLLMQRGKAWMAIAVLSVTPMIHPYGVFYLGSAALLAFGVLGLRKERLSKAVLAVFAVSALVWLAHGLYVLQHWQGFVYDTSHRFGEMATGTGATAVSRIGLEDLFSFGLIAVTAGLALWFRVAVGHLLAFSAAAWLHSHLRIEEPYWPFDDLCYVLVGLAFAQIVAHVIAAKNGKALVNAAAAAVVGVSLLGAFYKSGIIEGPIGYFADIQVSGMHVADEGVPYFTPEDRQALRDVLASLPQDRPSVVEVYPWSETFLFADLDDARVRYQVPYFDSMFRPREQWLWGYGPTDAPVPDLYIVRASRYTPPHLRHRPDAMFERAARQPNVGPPEVVHSRGATEIWYALRARPSESSVGGN